jgi:hypothetical protein
MLWLDFLPVQSAFASIRMLALDFSENAVYILQYSLAFNTFCPSITTNDFG